MRQLLLLVLLVGATLVPLAHAAYEENIREDVYIIRPANEYMIDSSEPVFLENEDLTFFACIETTGVPLRLSVLCLDTFEFEDVPAQPWGNLNCYIGSTNLEHLGCTRARVQAEYVLDGENLKLSRDIRINAFSNTLNRVVETQFTDGGWQSALDTAYGLYVLSRFPEVFDERIDKALDYLKTNRNNEEKCWPKEGCRLSTTANILFLLGKAGYEDLRVQRDGQVFLEKTQIYLDGTSWSVDVIDHHVNLNNSVDTSCVVDYDTAPTAFSLAKYPEIQKTTFVPEHDALLNVVCTEPAIVHLNNQYGEKMLTYQGDNFTYTIPQPCWTFNHENITCDTRATLYAINTPLATKQKSAANGYLRDLVESDRTAGSHVGGNWSNYNDALYVHAGLANADDVLTSLLFRQNNNGSWHDNTTHYETSFYEASEEEIEQIGPRLQNNVTLHIITSGEVVMGLLEDEDFTREHEVILDAERFVSLYEDDIGLNYTEDDLTDEDVVESYLANRSIILNDTKRNAMAFFVLQNNARPLLRTNPQVMIITEPVMELDIINPTIFDLEDITYELSSSLQQHISVEEKDYIGAFSFRRITITTRKTDPTDAFGYLRLLKGSNEYAKVPIIVESTPRINISLPAQLTVFGSATVLPFSVSRSLHEFSCSLEWLSEGISSQSAFDINNAEDTYSYPVQFAKLETENSIYEGTITCIAAGVTFVVPFGTNIIRFSSKPLQVRPQILELTENNSERIIEIKNVLDRTIDVELSLVSPDPYLVISDPFLNLYPGESRNVTLEVIPALGENYSTSNSVILKTFSLEERIIVDVDYTSQPTGTNIVLFSIIIGSVLLAFSLVIYLFMTRRDEIMEWYDTNFRKEDFRRKIRGEVARIEHEEELLAVRNMIRILKLQGNDDTEVRKRLMEEGYTEEDIDRAIKGPAVESSNVE